MATQNLEKLNEMKLGDHIKEQDLQVELKSHATARKQDALNLAFALLLMATNISMQSAQTDAKSLQAAQSQLQDLNNAQNDVSFEQLLGANGDQVKTIVGAHVTYHYTRDGQVVSYSHYSKWAPDGTGGVNKIVINCDKHSDFHATHSTLRKATANDFIKLGDKNQIIEAQRNFIGNKLMVVQQNAQVTSSTLNTTTDFAAQQIQEMGNICSLLTQITNLICQLSKSR